MRPAPRALLVGALLALTGLLPLPGREARAEGAVLDGRTAPDIVFASGWNGIEPGMRLSGFRGKVVWVKFILRDCPLCAETLPRAQELHERWSGSGLVVIAVMHRYGPAEAGPALRRQGVTFRVGTDADGAQARRYGVGRRPADYVIGVDGRVKASNGAPEAVLLRELAQYRVRRVEPVPEGLEEVREAVWSWDYGQALRRLSGGVASPEAESFGRRVREAAWEDLEGRLDWARRLAARGERDAVRTLLDRMSAHYRETALAPRVEAARARLLPGR